MKQYVWKAVQGLFSGLVIQKALVIKETKRFYYLEERLSAFDWGKRIDKVKASDTKREAVKVLEHSLEVEIAGLKERINELNLLVKACQHLIEEECK